MQLFLFCLKFRMEEISEISRGTGFSDFFYIIVQQDKPETN